MTPKKKALELFSNYRFALSLPSAPIPNKDGMAKYLIILGINEIVSELSLYYDNYDCTETLERVNYWVEVKNELEKL